MPAAVIACLYIGSATSPASEDPLDACRRAEGIFQLDESLVVGLEVAVEEFRVRGMADGDEHAGGVDGCRFAGC